MRGWLLSSLVFFSDDSKAVSIMTLYADMKAHASGKLTITGVAPDVPVDQMEVTMSIVPEPSSLLLVGNGIFMLAGRVARKGLQRRSVNSPAKALSE